jgi:hypothetical protein
MNDDDSEEIFETLTDDGLIQIDGDDADDADDDFEDSEMMDVDDLILAEPLTLRRRFGGRWKTFEVLYALA